MYDPLTNNAFGHLTAGPTVSMVEEPTSLRLATRGVFPHSVQYTWLKNTTKPQTVFVVHFFTIRLQDVSSVTFTRCFCCCYYTRTWSTQ